MDTESLYSASQFRALGHDVVDQLADYLEAVVEGDIERVLPWEDPIAQWNKWENKAFSGSVAPKDLIASYLSDSQHVHHPRYVGHQMAPALPLVAMMDLVASLVNNSTAIYEMGPQGVLMEQRVVKWMGEQLGFPKDCDGIFTSGGTLGNLTALLAARQAMGGDDVWSKGTEDSFCLLVSGHTHYSVERAVGIMGWGNEGIVKIPLDDKYKMNVNALKEGYQTAIRSKKKVIAVVANACSTATGSHDPIPEIADFCEAHSLWLHVDGAHGASAALSPKYRHLLKGIERAHSVVWDAHKMMLMPALTTATLFRDRAHSYDTFAQRASYLFEKSAEEEWYNLCHRTLECTKRNFAFRVYAGLSILGPKVFGDYVTQMYDQAKTFAAMIKDHKQFDLATQPESNIVCFRLKDLDNEGHTKLRKQVLAEGKYYLVQTTLNNQVHLRTTLMNPATTTKDLKNLLTHLTNLQRRSK